MIDIIIVNYNSTDYLVGCLKSLYESLGSLPAKIFVMDNASEDHPERIKEMFSHVSLFKSSYNMGFSKAVNILLQKGEAPYALILNPDTHITHGFFSPVIEYMEKNQDIGVMGPRILDNDGRLQNSARSFPTPLTAFFGRSSFLSKQFPKNPITFRNLLSLKSDGKSPMSVDWISGACMMVRRKAMEEIGLLDERFFMYWEDADWCKRMWDANWRVIYFPEVSVYHYVGGSSEKKVFRSVVEFHKSVYRLFGKHLYPSLSVLKPLVLGGLALRLFFILSLQIIQQSLSWRSESPLTPNLSPRTPKRIKILRVISRLNIGGPAIHVYLLTKGLDPERFESVLVTGKISPQEGDMSYLFATWDKKPIIIPALQREISLRTDPKAFFNIFRILYQEKPDIVHTHTAKAGSSTRFAVFIHNLVKNHKILVIHTFHGHVFEGYFSRINSFLFMNVERLLARVTDVIIAISETQKQELSEKYRIAPAEKIRTIKLGFNLTPFFSCNRFKGRFRDRLGLSDEMFLIGIVGRLVPIKNHKMFFRAAKFFIEQNHNFKVKFVVIGDGELGYDLEAYSQAQGLTEHVIFCGWIKDVPSVYADLDILALTSLNEGTPVSIIESMASSVPVIATDAGGVRDLLGRADVGSGLRLEPTTTFHICERGILCQKDNPMDFANGLKYLIKEPMDEREARVKRACSFVKEKFDQQRLFNDMESLYMDLMKNKP